MKSLQICSRLRQAQNSSIFYRFIYIFKNPNTEAARHGKHSPDARPHFDWSFRYSVNRASISPGSELIQGEQEIYGLCEPGAQNVLQK